MLHDPLSMQFNIPLLQIPLESIQFSLTHPFTQVYMTTDPEWGGLHQTKPVLGLDTCVDLKGTSLYVSIFDYLTYI
jgi:hypothetical protein